MAKKVKAGQSGDEVQPAPDEKEVVNVPETKTPEHFNIGNGSFHVESTKAKTREDFIEEYKGKVNFDLGEVYDHILTL